MPEPGDTAGDCPRCGSTLTLVGSDPVVIGNWCPSCDLVRVLDYHDVASPTVWHPDQPDATTGRDPEIGVGNLTCTCGCAVIEADSGDDAVTLTPTPGTRMLPRDESIDCPECERSWYLVDDGEHWDVVPDA